MPALHFLVVVRYVGYCCAGGGAVSVDSGSITAADTVMSISGSTFTNNVAVTFAYDHVAVLLLSLCSVPVMQWRPRRCQRC
jgi:hypothetical protein